MFYKSPHLLYTKKLKKFCKKVTGKDVKIKNIKNPYQDLNNIYIPKNNGNPINYSIYHEVIHYIIASDDDRKRPNLRFGEKNIPYDEQSKTEEEFTNDSIEETIVGYLQYYLIEKYNLFFLLFEKDRGTKEEIEGFLEHIANFNEDIPLEEKRNISFERLNSLNIDVEKEIENTLLVL